MKCATCGREWAYRAGDEAEWKVDAPDFYCSGECFLAALEEDAE